MSCVKHEHDCDVIINKHLGFYDSKSNKIYTSFYELWYKTLAFFIGI